MVSRAARSILGRLGQSSQCFRRHSINDISQSPRFRSQHVTRSPHHTKKVHHHVCTSAHAQNFSTSIRRYAAPQSADAILESLNDLYATAKDEFEIAAEETEKKTVYAEEDRKAARIALEELEQVFERSVKESSPEVAKEVQGRVGPRIRELSSAVKNMEDMALEDH